MINEEGCLHKNYKDSYGNYRSANHSQLKHHWWWKCNFVFNKLKSVREYDGKLTYIQDIFCSLVSTMQCLNPIHWNPHWFFQCEPLVNSGLSLIDQCVLLLLPNIPNQLWLILECKATHVLPLLSHVSILFLFIVSINRYLE